MLFRPLAPLLLALGLTLLALAFYWTAPAPALAGEAPAHVPWLLTMGSVLTLAGGVPLVRTFGRG